MHGCKYDRHSFSCFVPAIVRVISMVPLCRKTCAVCCPDMLPVLLLQTCNQVLQAGMKSGSKTSREVEGALIGQTGALMLMAVSLGLSGRVLARLLRAHQSQGSSAARRVVTLCFYASIMSL